MSTEELLIETYGDTSGSLQVLAALPPGIVHTFLQALLDRDLLQIALLLESGVVGVAELKILTSQNLYGRVSRPYSVEVIERVVEDLRRRSCHESLSVQWPSASNSCTTSTRNSVGPDNLPSNFASPRGSILSAVDPSVDTLPFMREVPVSPMTGGTIPSGHPTTVNCEVCGRQSRAAQSSDGSIASAIRQKQIHESLWLSTDWYTPKKLQKLVERCGILTQIPVLPTDLLSDLMAAIKTRWSNLPSYLRLEVTELFHSSSDHRLREVFETSGITADHLGFFPPKDAIALRAKNSVNEKALEWRYAILHCLHHRITGYALSPPEPPKSKRPRDSRLVTLERQRKMENDLNPNAWSQGRSPDYLLLPSSTTSTNLMPLETNASDDTSEYVDRWLDDRV